MIDEILRKRKRKPIKDLNIVPILDMLTTVIFFLLMSTTFIEYTKLTLPPAATAVSPSADLPPPLSPKLILKVNPDGLLTGTLFWSGASPGDLNFQAEQDQIVSKASEVIGLFSSKYPSEKTLQISLEESIPYQRLIDIMDAARDYLPDTVLVSYLEAKAK